MRIAYVINSLEFGGAQRPIPDIAALIAAHGGEITVFALERRDGLAIAHLERHGVPFRLREGGRTDHPAALRWLRAEMESFRPDLIWTSLTRATLLGRIVADRMGLPAVHWQHNAWLRPANAALLRLLAGKGRAALWVADSETVAEVTRERLGVAPDRIAVWPIFRADPRAPRPAPWREGEPVRIGSLGRLHPAKGYDVLLEALSLLRGAPDLPAWTLTLAGEGPERARLEALARAHALPVTFAGYTDDPFGFLRTLHVYAQPSRREGMCVAAHEAMSCGLPVVATPAGEIPRTLGEDGRFGRIVPFDNPPALASALRRLLTDPAARAAAGESARARVLERFGPEAFARHGRGVLDRAPINFPGEET